MAEQNRGLALLGTSRTMEDNMQVSGERAENIKEANASGTTV